MENSRSKQKHRIRQRRVQAVILCKLGPLASSSSHHQALNSLNRVRLLLSNCLRFAHFFQTPLLRSVSCQASAELTLAFPFCSSNARFISSNNSELRGLPVWIAKPRCSRSLLSDYMRPAEPLQATSDHPASCLMHARISLHKASTCPNSTAPTAFQSPATCPTTADCFSDALLRQTRLPMSDWYGFTVCAQPLHDILPRSPLPPSETPPPITPNSRSRLLSLRRIFLLRSRTALALLPQRREKVPRRPAPAFDDPNRVVLPQRQHPLRPEERLPRVFVAPAVQRRYHHAPAARRFPRRRKLPVPQAAPVRDAHPEHRVPQRSPSTPRTAAPRSVSQRMPTRSSQT